MVTRWFWHLQLWWQRSKWRGYTPEHPYKHTRGKLRAHYHRRLRRGVMIFVNPSTYKDERMKEL